MTQQSDPFYFGRRQLVRYDKTGQPLYQWQPLTLDDFLDPQPDDEFDHGRHHDELVRALRRLFRYSHRYNPTTLVVSNLKLVWDRPGLAQPAPDLAVIPQTPEPAGVRTTFDVAAEGVAPRFVLEVTSPRFAKLDLVDKLAIYAAAGISEYWIVDQQFDGTAGETDERPQLRLLGYQLRAGRYEAIAPAADVRFYSAVNRFWLQLSADGRAIELVDERSGQVVTPSPDFIEPSPGTAAEAASRAQSIADQLDLSSLGFGPDRDEY